MRDFYHVRAYPRLERVVVLPDPPTRTDQKGPGDAYMVVPHNTLDDVQSLQKLFNKHYDGLGLFVEHLLHHPRLRHLLSNVAPQRHHNTSPQDVAHGPI